MLMLTAYFDDSGTHASSAIVLIAGVYGHPNQFEYLSNLWGEHLRAPCPGKLAISKFHMTECQAGEGEFFGWKRIEREYLSSELTEAMIKTGIRGYCSAVDRRSWDKYVQGELRRASGDAETICIISTFTGMVRQAALSAPGHDLTLIFDDRPQKKHNIERIYDVYKASANAVPHPADIVSVGFASSKKTVPLQAADLFAWECYQDTLDALNGKDDKNPPKRKALERLLATGRFYLTFCDEVRTKRLSEQKHDLQFLTALGNHVSFT